MSIGPYDFGGFDIFILIILLISGVLAMSRGFFREVISLIALVVGVIATAFLLGQYSVPLQESVSPSWLADGILILGGFAGSYLIVAFVLRNWARQLRGKEPGFVDRLLGLAYGVARGILIGALMVVIMKSASSENRPPTFMENATLYPVLDAVATQLHRVDVKTAREKLEDLAEPKDSD